MERTIELSKFQRAVEEAYEEVKNRKEGAVSPLLHDVDTEKFGISLTFADGTVINKGDTDVASPVGAIAKVAVASILLSQNTPEELINKSGRCACSCARKCDSTLPHGHHIIRAISAMQPIGDPDSKWNLIEDRMTGMMGSAPLLDDALYRELTAKAEADNVENLLAQNDYYLYDDAPSSIDLAMRLKAMTATPAQLSMMGATIAADGVNPSTKSIVFDGSISERIVGMMAAKGPRRMTLPWNLLAGIPAKSSYAGSILGVFPGVFAIAAYSPLLNEAGVSDKAVRAIISFMNSLQLSVFQSAKLKVHKS